MIQISMAEFLVIMDCLRGSCSLADRADGTGIFRYLREVRLGVFNSLFSRLDEAKISLDVSGEDT